MFRILPKDHQFFDLFEKAAANVQDGAELLKKLFDEFTDVKEMARQIEEVEHRGDTFTHDLILKLNTSFITPLEREDILALASSLDDVLDLIHGAAVRLNLYKVSDTTPEAKELAFLILKSVRELNRAVGCLAKNMKGVHDHCVEVNSLENEADRVCRDAIARLFHHEKDPIEIMKWKELYETLETATDRCEDAANVLESISMKNT
jgi:predicted phosphate transport protein (TIGR00153 family)